MDFFDPEPLDEDRLRVFRSARPRFLDLETRRHWLTLIGVCFLVGSLLGVAIGFAIPVG